MPGPRGANQYLQEANIAGLLAEAASADVEVVLPDQTVAVTADAANEVCKIPAVSKVGVAAYQERQPGPNLRGWVYQVFGMLTDGK